MMHHHHVSVEEPDKEGKYHGTTRRYIATDGHTEARYENQCDSRRRVYVSNCSQESCLGVKRVK